MRTAKEFGKTARSKKINAPTLDTQFLTWLKSINSDNKIHYFVQWWEGWYAELDEHHFFQDRQFAK